MRHRVDSRPRWRQATGGRIALRAGRATLAQFCRLAMLPPAVRSLAVSPASSRERLLSMCTAFAITSAAWLGAPASAYAVANHSLICGADVSVIHQAGIVQVNFAWEWFRRGVSYDQLGGPHEGEANVVQTVVFKQLRPDGKWAPFYYSVNKAGGLADGPAKLSGTSVSYDAIVAREHFRRGGLMAVQRLFVHEIGSSRTCSKRTSIVIPPGGPRKQTLPASWRVSTAGIGPIRFGMTLAHARRASEMWLKVDPINNPACETAPFDPKIPFTRVLLTNYRVQRVDITTRSAGDAHGIRVGDSVRRLRQAYGNRLSRHQAPYTLVPLYELTSGNFRLEFFVTHRGVVEQISAGRIPEIDFIEGCV